MSGEEQLQAIVDKTIENAIMNLDNYQNEVNASNDVLKVKEIKFSGKTSLESEKFNILVGISK